LCRSICRDKRGVDQVLLVHCKYDMYLTIGQLQAWYFLPRHTHLVLQLPALVDQELRQKRNCSIKNGIKAGLYRKYGGRNESLMNGHCDCQLLVVTVGYEMKTVTSHESHSTWPVTGSQTDSSPARAWYENGKNLQLESGFRD